MIDTAAALLDLPRLLDQRIIFTADLVPMAAAAGQRHIGLDVARSAPERAGTGMIKLGVSGDVVEAILNHTPDRLVATYRRHDYSEEKWTVLQVWADHLGG